MKMEPTDPRFVDFMGDLFFSRGSFSILFNHRSFEKPVAVPAGVLMVFWKDPDPWKEWGRFP